MHLLAAQPNALFLGQGVGQGGDGVATFKDFDGIPMSQRLEMPVAEELQMGIGIGLALQGFLPILIYPRCDFLLRAADQLANHLDRLPEMSQREFYPKVIIRTRKGKRFPLDAGPQHSEDYTEALKHMTGFAVWVQKITRLEDILPTYEKAISEPRSSLIVEAL